MKKHIVMLLTAALFIGNLTVQAQLSDKATLLNAHSLGVDRAAIRAERDFWKKNGEQKGELWYKTPNVYLATFSDSGIQNSVVYDLKGNWAYTIRQYYEKDLPADIRSLVKSKYYDDTIGWIKEVWNWDMPETPVYIIHIENNSSWKELSVHDGVIDVLESFRKF